MERTTFNGKTLLLMLFLLCGLAGCKTARKAGKSAQPATAVRYLSSKARLAVPTKDAVLTVNGTMKLVSNERMQLSFQMPILRTEVARMDVTPEEVLLVDRMGKRYVRATLQELKDVLPKKADFARLEKLLFDAARPGGKRELTGKELGIPALEKGRIELSDFSDAPFSLTPTELSARYTQVTLPELLELLMSL